MRRSANQEKCGRASLEPMGGNIFSGLVGSRQVPNTYRYKAFISYSHTDGQSALWLQQARETYRVPRKVCHDTGCSEQDDEVATRIIVSMRKRHTENGNHIHYYPPDSPGVVQE